MNFQPTNRIVNPSEVMLFVFAASLLTVAHLGKTTANSNIVKTEAPADTISLPISDQVAQSLQTAKEQSFALNDDQTYTVVAETFSETILLPVAETTTSQP